MKRKIPKEIKALGSRYLPSADGLVFPTFDPPPAGLRLSEPCSACCILDYFLKRKSFITDGVSNAGHMMAEYFIQSLLDPVCVAEREKPYQWAQVACSGMDSIVENVDAPGHYDPTFNNPYVGHFEYKTSSDQNAKPKTVNREQVIRQRVVMARHYGITDDELFNSYLFVITKGGKQTNYIHGPFLVEPTKEELDVAKREIDLRIMVSEDILEEGLEEDPHQHPLLRAMRKGSCTRCFPLERAEPSNELEKALSRGRDDWEDAIQLDRLTKWYKGIKDQVKPHVPPGQTVETDYFLVRHTESGRLYLDAKNLG